MQFIFLRFLNLIFLETIWLDMFLTLYIYITQFQNFLTASTSWFFFLNQAFQEVSIQEELRKSMLNYINHRTAQEPGQQVGQCYFICSVNYL